MPKINVYLPDDLAEAVRDTGVPVSAICQRALEQAVRRIGAIRQLAAEDPADTDLAARLPSLTARTVAVLTLARQSATAAVTSADLLTGMLDEGANLALQVLRSMEVDPAGLRQPSTAEPGRHAFSDSAVNALELAVGEATGLGHNYVGCEHLLIGLAAEPDGAAGKALRAAGADARAVRRAVSAALAGYAHLRAGTGTPNLDTMMTAVRQELAPLIARVEALETSQRSA
jgi:ATP-dependent Clp protease ATP-binding subunit ClpA